MGLSTIKHEDRQLTSDSLLVLRLTHVIQAHELYLIFGKHCCLQLDLKHSNSLYAFRFENIQETVHREA
jgi:hypothetical protein